jgi:hypothetical protein
VKRIHLHLHAEVEVISWDDTTTAAGPCSHGP